LPPNSTIVGKKSFYFSFGATIPLWAMVSSFTRFLDHTQLLTAVDKTPLDERSARRRDLYLTTHNTHNRQTSMSPGGIRTHNLSRWAAADLSLRPPGHWDRQRKQFANAQILISSQPLQERFTCDALLVPLLLHIVSAANESYDMGRASLFPKDTTPCHALPDTLFLHRHHL